jgi:hypothetical protein
MSVAKKLKLITETSCLVNVMHEILVDRWKKRIPSIAVCPTQKLEKTTGYDVALPEFEKMLYLQFKAYLRRNYKVLDYFRIYPRQQKTLLKYPTNCAFYVFPDYKTHDQMSKDRQLELTGKPFEILNNTWFVEVHSIPVGTKKIMQNDLASKRIPSIKWSKLSGMLDTCGAGFRIVKINDYYTLEDTEEIVVEEIEIPSGTSSLFYTRKTPINMLNDTDEMKVLFT